MNTMRTRKPRLYARRNRAIAITVIFLAICTNNAGADDFDFDRRFPDTETFEDEIRDANEACLPDPYPLIRHNYAYRLADSLVTECATENMTTAQTMKYTILALACVSTGPVGLAAAGYTAGEVSTDGMKCILKALVSASSGLTEEEKNSAKSAIDFVAALKDWKDFSENVATVAKTVPELANPEHVLNLKSAVEAGAAAYERSG